MVAIVAASRTLLALTALSPPRASLISPPRASLISPRMGLLEEAIDGNIASALEIGAIAVAAAVGGGTAWSLVQREEAQAEAAAKPPPIASQPKVAINVDLGPDGEPKGVSRLLFKPLLPRSELIVVNLSMPLGMLIEERDSTIVVTGALPGYGATGQVQEGDLLRAVTAYASVAGDAPMWQQVTSGTPIGDVARRRLIFKTEEATYANVRDAIASHRTDDGDDKVTLVLERVSNATTPRPPTAGAQLESLTDVLSRDLSTPAGRAAGEAPQGQPPPTAGERARRLLDFRGGAVRGERAGGVVRCTRAADTSVTATRRTTPSSAWRVPAIRA